MAQSPLAAITCPAWAQQYANAEQKVQVSQTSKYIKFEFLGHHLQEFLNAWVDGKWFILPDGKDSSPDHT